MAFLDRTDWRAKWIASPIVGGPYSIPPAPYLRNEFSLPTAGQSAAPLRVSAARLYVTALGLYEFHLNGEKVGNDLFTPGRTEYTKRVPYHVYDVTSLLRPGAN